MYLRVPANKNWHSTKFQCGRTQQHPFNKGKHTQKAPVIEYEDVDFAFLCLIYFIMGNPENPILQFCFYKTAN